jgi:hypothetical protein
VIGSSMLVWSLREATFRIEGRKRIEISLRMEVALLMSSWSLHVSVCTFWRFACKLERMKSDRRDPTVSINIYISVVCLARKVPFGDLPIPSWRALNASPWQTIHRTTGIAEFFAHEGVHEFVFMDRPVVLPTQLSDLATIAVSRM